MFTFDIFSYFVCYLYSIYHLGAGLQKEQVIMVRGSRIPSALCQSPGDSDHDTVRKMQGAGITHGIKQPLTMTLA